MGTQHRLVTGWQEISFRMQEQSGEQPTHSCSHLNLSQLDHTSVSVSVDLSVGSSHRNTGGQDFNRPHQMDHLSLLGTSPSVSVASILPIDLNFQTIEHT